MSNKQIGFNDMNFVIKISFRILKNEMSSK